MMSVVKNLLISASVLDKISTRHRVDVAEVQQCFLNREGKLLLDNRVSTKTNPPTLWFIASTNKKRLLKIVYIQINSEIVLKTAYEPNDVEIAIYARHGLLR